MLNRSMRRKRQRGLTLIELVVAFTIMLSLSSMAVPLARSKVRAQRERELRADLEDMRHAIDKYKDMCDAAYLGQVKVGTDCFPESLEILVEGVKLPGPDGKKLKFLRRIPLDPFTHTTEWGLRRRRSGFPFVEMMVVITIIVILITIAIPIYQKSIIRAKESVLKNNLFTLRTVIDNYTYDKEKAPQSLPDLVTDGYLKKMPLDPITNTDQWKTVMEDASQAINQSEPGIFDIHSNSDKISLDGTPYSEW